MLLAAPEATPPEGFDRRVLAAVAAHRASEGDRPSDGAGAPHRGHGRRPATRLAALAAAAVVLVVAGVAAAFLRDGDRDADLQVATEMRTGRGRTVGEVTLSGDRPVAVTVDVPEWAELVDRWGDEASGGYWLAVETRDGQRTLLPVTSTGGDAGADAEADDEGAPGGQAGGPGPYSEGDAGAAGGWTVTVDAARDEVATVSVVDAEGRTWCSGTFPA